MYSGSTGKTYFFACSAWLKKEGGDMSGCRKELLVGNPDSTGGVGRVKGGRSMKWTKLASQSGVALKAQEWVGRAKWVQARWMHLNRVKCRLIFSRHPAVLCIDPIPLPFRLPLPLTPAPRITPPCALSSGPTNYHIEVYTSDLRGAGTDADVSIVIYGECGAANAE